MNYPSTVLGSLRRDGGLDGFGPGLGTPSFVSSVMASAAWELLALVYWAVPVASVYYEVALVTSEYWTMPVLVVDLSALVVASGVLLTPVVVLMY